MSKQNNNTEENERNQNRANAVTQVPARTVIQNTCSRPRAIDPITEKYMTSLLIQFPAFLDVSSSGKGSAARSAPVRLREPSTHPVQNQVSPDEPLE